MNLASLLETPDAHVRNGDGRDRNHLGLTLIDLSDRSEVKKLARTETEGTASGVALQSRCFH